KPFAGVRVGVKNGGCAGMAYTMEYAESAAKFDEVVEDKGVKLLIDPKAVLFLLGTEMDFKVDKLSSTFVFNNPNQTPACGCGVARGGRTEEKVEEKGRKGRRKAAEGQGRKSQATLVAEDATSEATSGSVSHMTRLRPQRLAA